MVVMKLCVTTYDFMHQDALKQRPFKTRPIRERLIMKVRLQVGYKVGHRQVRDYRLAKVY